MWLVMTKQGISHQVSRYRPIHRGECEDAVGIGRSLGVLVTIHYIAGWSSFRTGSFPH